MLKEVRYLLPLCLLLLCVQWLAPGCKTAKDSNNPKAIFNKHRRWLLVEGKVAGKRYNLLVDSNKHFEVILSSKRFRGFDGSINIIGMDPDSSSMFHNGMTYFFNRKDDLIGIYWIQKIQWIMERGKESNEISRLVSELFYFNGKYAYDNDTGVLSFYKEDERGRRDVIIVLKAKS